MSERPPAAKVPRLDACDLVSFAKVWYPFGGPTADEILVKFGLTPLEYLKRVGHVLDFYSSDQLGLSQETHYSLHRFCWNQIADSETVNVS